MLPSEILERGWCQGMMAQDEWGLYVGITEDAAVSWCLVGAASKALDWFTPEMTAFLTKVNELVGGDATVFNDSPDRTQAEVVALAKFVEIKLGLRPDVPEISAIELQELVESAR